MSTRAFTVFQDTASSDAPTLKISRPTAMTTRSTTLNNISTATAQADLPVIDKENFNPVTGERAGATTGTKKRKTSVLATKVHPSTTKPKKEKDTQLEPEQKKRKASGSSSTKSKSKKDIKASGSVKKSVTKRTASRKVSPMPSLNEEEGEEEDKSRATQASIDSRCYELTVKPLADVSQAYEEASVFDIFDSTLSAECEDKVKFDMVKASSVEPEIRDYFQPSQALFSSSSRLRGISEDLSEPRTFSTPERRQIYAAFTFCSPSASTTITSQASTSGARTPTEEL